ncbi:hypothetical protein BLS_004972 [Venturia inaequalis]|uniref:Uncharacterized protein n=1 Tax=Venturia inaequalis TaxID=5025 RepID=A0A8H3V8G1_VENIN|nr:hypothetical protein BLS_004972 [Venturia inaequalis]KAE9983083.1 hypothetical protein EG328_010320 [Venturia inaequalis]KAE9991979.1 hypothetical protein EG327_010455 [Venturia inaequalis]
MVAPYAGGSPPEGQGNWNPTNAYPPQQSRQQQQPGRYEPHALSQPPLDVRGLANSRQMYSNTPPPDSMPQQYPYQDSVHSAQNMQQLQTTDRQTRDFDLAPPGGPPPERLKNGSRRPSGSRVCGKCGEPLAGQFVRALDNTFHLECFTCQECGKIVASKFFPVPDEGPNQYPLCETDYFKRLDLICYQCGGALRGSYITALDRKYHIEHFTCTLCPTVFGAQDSYYEHEGNVYCHYHYSTKFAQRCTGCQNSILKQFVEIFRNGQNQHWHPECYMIHKYWNVRLHDKDKALPALDQAMSEEAASEEIRRAVREEEERVEEKVLWIWRTLSTFEERSATCISDMLLHVSNGVYFDGIMAAKRFIVHIDVFFACTDDLDRKLIAQTGKGLSYNREAKLLCKKVVSFFSLLSESHDGGMRRLGVTQELLSLVTGLAHYLKLLIRICLQGALKLERETGSSEGLSRFLNQINSLEEKLEQSESADPIAESEPYVRGESDHCPVCSKPVEDRCVKKADRCYHLNCLKCKTCNRDMSEDITDVYWSQSVQQVFCSDHRMQYADGEGGFIPITRLQQYVHLLLVAHARLLATLRSQGALPHTSDDPNLAAYDSTQGHRIGPGSLTKSMTPPLLRSDTRSKSYAGTTAPPDRRGSTSYEQTLGDIRRLRSTRMDRHLSSTQKKARSSRIIEGPGADFARPGSAGDADGGPGKNRQSLQIIHDRDGTGENQLTFGTQSIALDDIPRLVAAEQAREQRPNASKYARGNLVGHEPKPKLLNGHRRDISGGRELDQVSENQVRSRRYFSELSALEYFIVRHIAVLSMEPLLEGHFNQQELLDLIETKRPTFWDRFGKAFKADQKAAKKKGIFGKTLEQVVDRDGAESTDGVGPGALRIPALVDLTVTAMRNMDMSVEGVFRKNGNIRRLRELAEQIDMQGCEGVDFSKETPVQVAALLKKFLRELPDPIMTHKLHSLWITAAKIPDEEKRRRVLHLTCCLLPKVHRDTMEILFNFLNWVSSFHTVDEETGSKMDIHNLATVIAPNLLYSSQKSPDMDSSFLAIEAVHSMIECNDSMCEVPEDILSILHDSSLFEGNAELTTKDILKRWGEIGRVPQTTTITTPPGRGGGSRQGRSTQVQHIAQDPMAWQNEASVRHVGQGHPGYGATPPQQLAQGQYHDTGSPNRNSQFRSSGIQKPGALGITGAG